MNLAQFITYVKETSLRSPFINQAIDGDVYQINSIENQYGIFCITPMSVTTTDNIMTINSTLFYVDRLVEGEYNMNQIQSDGVTCLKTIIEEITNDEDVDISLDGDVTYTVFRYKFTDECAGCFAEVSLNVSNDDCEESYLAPKSGGGESVIEIIKQNGIALPIVDKTVNIDAYTKSNVDSKLLGINTTIEDLTDKVNDNTDDIAKNSDDINTINETLSTVEQNLTGLTEDLSGVEQNINDLIENLTELEQNLTGLTEQVLDNEEDISELDSRLSTVEDALPNLERFTIRYNPKFDTLHRPAGDRSPLLLNRCSIETINGKRFFNIDIIYNNYVPGSAPSTGFETDEILFLFPRMAAVNYSDYTSLLDSQYSSYHTPTELYQLNQYYVAGWINRISAMNYNTTTTNSIMCQISNVGEVINNTNGFFKSTSSTQDNVYHITGRYEIASDWTLEEYEMYVFA